MSARRKSTGREFYKYWGLGFEFAAFVGLGLYLGYQADQHWVAEPWGMLTGGAAGLAGGMYLLFKAGFAMMREFDNNDGDGPEAP